MPTRYFKLYAYVMFPIQFIIIIHYITISDTAARAFPNYTVNSDYPHQYSIVFIGIILGLFPINPT